MNSVWQSNVIYDGNVMRKYPKSSGVTAALSDWHRSVRVHSLLAALILFVRSLLIIKYVIVKQIICNRIKNICLIANSYLTIYPIFFAQNHHYNANLKKFLESGP